MNRIFVIIIRGLLLFDKYNNSLYDNKGDCYMRKTIAFLLALITLFLTSCQNSNNTADNCKDDPNVIKRYEKTELGTAEETDGANVTDRIVNYSKIGMLGENRIFRLQEKQDGKFMCLTDSEGNVIKE
ncbi:MAG TPA: hypothetical protein VIM13_04380, partial [Clostridia bacterium]